MKKEHGMTILSDLYIDFLGSLIPGLFATAFALLTLCTSISLFCEALRHAFPSLKIPIESTMDSPVIEVIDKIGIGSYGSTGMIIILILAYVIGSMFYRQDPKVPDRLSAQFVWNKAEQKDRGRLAVQLNDKGEIDAQFPYLHLRMYLKGRGLCHLAEMIPWQKGEDQNQFQRTKMFINIIKIRLHYSLPDKCKDIVRNEAHVRMATSVWYASRWIRIAAYSALVLFVFSAVLMIIHNNFIPNSIATVSVIPLVYFVGITTKIKIEKFLHYLRVREIVYVLETAYFAEKNGIDLDLDSLKTKANQRVDPTWTTPGDPVNVKSQAGHS